MDWEVDSVEQYPVQITVTQSHCHVLPWIQLYVWACIFKGSIKYSFFHVHCCLVLVWFRYFLFLFFGINYFLCSWLSCVGCTHPWPSVCAPLMQDGLFISWLVFAHHYQKVTSHSVTILLYIALRSYLAPFHTGSRCSIHDTYTVTLERHWLKSKTRDKVSCTFWWYSPMLPVMVSKHQKHSWRLLNPVHSSLPYSPQCGICWPIWAGAAAGQTRHVPYDYRGWFWK